MNNYSVITDFELVKNEYSDRDYNINISIPEFTCVCPRTAQPDFATFEIQYVPNKLIVELKSLKIYLQQYRTIGIFHETVTNKIMDDFKNACNPKKIQVIGNFNARGGISTQVIANWPK